MKFEVDPGTQVRFSHLNIRDEKHGDETVPACDLTFIWQAANSVLTMFDGKLLTSLYGPPTEAMEQGGLDGVEPVSQFPTLKFPYMASIKWADVATASLSIDYGLGKTLDLTPCKIHKFVLDCNEGGTVELKFTASCSAGLTERTLGKLALMIGQDVQIDVVATEVIKDLPLHDNKPTLVTLFGANAAH